MITTISGKFTLSTIMCTCSFPRVRDLLHRYHLSLNRECLWSTTNDFRTSFRHCSLFSTALWDVANSKPAHPLMLSSHLFLCLPCLLHPFTVHCKMVLADLMDGRLRFASLYSGGGGGSELESHSELLNKEVRYVVSFITT